MKIWHTLDEKRPLPGEQIVLELKTGSRICVEWKENTPPHIIEVKANAGGDIYDMEINIGDNFIKRWRSLNNRDYGRKTK